MATSSGVPKDNTISKEIRQFLDKLWRQVQDIGTGGGDVSLDTDGTMSSPDDVHAPSTQAFVTYVTSTLSSLPCFAANKNGTDQTNFTDNTYVKATFTTEIHDLGGYYDDTNSKWTPPAGIAFIHARVVLATTNLTDGDPIVMRLYKNGATYVSKSYITKGITNNQSLDISTQLQVNGTDYFEVFVNANTTGGGAATVNGTAGNTEFFGHMVAVS